MKKKWLVKTLALSIVVLFICVTVTPSIGVSSYIDDTTPPVTTISFNPPEPDGENGWYVSNVTVTLNATDGDSGVNTTMYRVDGDIWYYYTEPFLLVDDGENILIEFYSIDNAGNQEEIKSSVVDIDKSTPDISLTYEATGGNFIIGYEITFTATAWDDTSGMNKVDFYINEKKRKTVYSPGPTYEYVCNHFPIIRLNVRGAIHKPVITDEYVKFFALFVIILGVEDYYTWRYALAYDNAGNYDFDEIEDHSSAVTVYPGICIFKDLTLPNNYSGFIGKSYIRASFYDF